MTSQLKTYFNKQTNVAPLVVFRILFGVMMLFSMLRFWANGWIEKLYITPSYHFSYYGFAWVKPLGSFTYVLFAICAVSAVFVALGFKYRWAIITFFLSFTYIELMDKTTYLNHYYAISLLAFLMIFLPANARFSLDAYFKNVHFRNVPKWTIDSIKLMLGIIYFYAGLAKLNSDWLFKAMPLKIWLPSKYNLPFIGNSIMQQEWFHYAMSWCGMLYDLAIPFLLLYKKTRWFAFALVVFFHVFTRVLFPIGMFPFIMIVSTLIFFEAGFHEKCIAVLKKGAAYLGPRVKLKKEIPSTIKEHLVLKKQKYTIVLFAVFFSIQILFPFRYLAYPGELFWTEEGFRFSWRVMLMEKVGYTTFKIQNTKTGESFMVDNSKFLTVFQEKQMSFQPDFILEFAHYLGDYYAEQGIENVAVFAESYVALNGRLNQPFINPKVNLYNQCESFKHKTWILPFNDDIKGL